MEITIKQAAVLAIIGKQPGILGRDLCEAVADFVPQLNFYQFLERLCARGLVEKKKLPSDRAEINSYFLTKEGKEALAEVREFARKFVI